MSEEELRNLISESLKEGALDESFNIDKEVSHIYDYAYVDFNGEELEVDLEAAISWDEGHPIVDEVKAINLENFSEEQKNAINNYINSDEFNNEKERISEVASEVAREAYLEYLDDKAGIREGFSEEDQEINTDEFEDSIGSGLDDYEGDMNLDLETMPMSAVDMPIQDKAYLKLGGEESYDDEFSDVDGYTNNGDNYEGDYQDDNSVSPGYFNESDDENYIDDIGMAKNQALGDYNPIEDALHYVGGIEVWDSLSRLDKDAILADLERDFESSLHENNKTVKVTVDELQKIIKEGVAKLHKQSLIENRIEQINNELNNLSNPQAWQDAREDALSQRAKQNLNWEHVTTREKLQEVSFKDVASMIPVSTPKDTATIEANTQWEKVQKESVSDIMGRASDLMAEAKEKYNKISK